MTLREELKALRRHLDELAAGPEDTLMMRYALPRPPTPPGLYWRMRWLASRTLRFLEWIRVKPRYPWPPALKHAPDLHSSKPLLIWAVGVEPDVLRRACGGFAKLHDLRGFAPVLVTDVADFAFFSRLGWLVEYLPRLSGEGEAYDVRKAKFLARLYYGAPALPVRAGLEMDTHIKEIRHWVLRGR